MLTAVAVTLAFLPFYMWLRSPFARLPLHIDTGFYVSNHTVATRRFDYSRGWNAHFAGCSKVVPELFYSLMYLHCARRGAEHPCDNRSYVRVSRIAASLFNYVNAIAIGILSFQLGGQEMFYYAGLLSYALASSEPQYGVYFECGELFEILPNVASLSLLVSAVNHDDPWLFAAGAFVWAGGTFFVKLSSVAPFVVVFGVGVTLHPWGLWPTVLGGAGATLLYGAWMVVNGRRPGKLISALLHHETALGQRANWRAVLVRIKEKVRCLVRTWKRQPIFPALAILGVLTALPEEPLFWIYLVGLVGAYVVQAADCWYYQIPLLAPIAVLAAAGVVSLAGAGFIGFLLLGAGLVTWIFHNTVRARRLNRTALNRWCWAGYRPVAEIDRNVDVEAVVGEICETVQNNRLLIYGPCNQAYVLLGASYVTPIVAPETYLDPMCPGWQAELNRQLVLDAPEFILDTSNSFAASAARKGLGLDYRLVHKRGEQLRLYRLSTRSQPEGDYTSVRTFQPQMYQSLVAEEMLAGRAAGREDIPADVPTGPAGWSEEARALATLLRGAHEQGCRGLAVYGAGRFTIRNRFVYEQSPAPVIVVLDDRPEPHGPTFLNWPIRRPEDAGEYPFDAVVISTDRFNAAMSARVRKLWGDRVRILTMRAKAPPSRETAASGASA